MPPVLGKETSVRWCFPAEPTLFFPCTNRIRGLPSTASFERAQDQSLKT